MFSGIVEDQGIVLDRRQTPAGLRLRVRFAKLRPKLKTGDSVAVSVSGGNAAGFQGGAGWSINKPF